MEKWYNTVVNIHNYREEHLSEIVVFWRKNSTEMSDSASVEKIKNQLAPEKT